MFFSLELNNTLFPQLLLHSHTNFNVFSGDGDRKNSKYNLNVSMYLSYWLIKRTWLVSRFVCIALHQQQHQQRHSFTFPPLFNFFYSAVQFQSSVFKDNEVRKTLQFFSLFSTHTRFVIFSAPVLFIFYLQWNVKQKEPTQQLVACIKIYVSMVYVLCFYVYIRLSLYIYLTFWSDLIFSVCFLQDGTNSKNADIEPKRLFFFLLSLQMCSSVCLAGLSLDV